MAEAVQVPVSLIERAPHAPGCQIAGLWILPENGGRAVQQSGKCTCWKAEVDALLSQPNPTAPVFCEQCGAGAESIEHYDRCVVNVAPPSIADMVPGTTFAGRTWGEAEDDLWFRTALGAVSATGVRAEVSHIDPSTIRDVTPPAAP